MRFVETAIPGVVLVEAEPVTDERGCFARTYDAAAFAANGLDPHIEQCSVSYNARRGTLRGMHYQKAPHQEAKLVRVTRGAVLDVAVDLRPDSPSRWRWVAVELTEDNRSALHVPRGCAHGFYTLRDATEVTYQISAAYAPEAARGLRWDDPVLGIHWPGEPVVIGERDRGWPLLEGALS